MDLQLTGKRSIVTGGSAGIGLAVAKTLAQEGVEVVIPGRNKAKLDQAIAYIGSKKVRGLVADVATAEGAQKVIREVPETDILVNNLGIYEVKQFIDISDDDWLKIFETNVMSGVRLSRHYLPGMLGRDWGRIVFVSSESAINIPAEMIHYGMTKTAQLAVARGLAETTKGTRVTVNSVLPGPTRSEGIVEFLKSMSSNPNASEEQAVQEFFDKHRPSSLLRRLIEPEEVAALVAYVASPLAAATNGAPLRVEGGLLRNVA